MDSQESVREVIKPKTTEVVVSLGNDSTPEPEAEPEEFSEAEDTETEEEPDETMRLAENETSYDSASENEFFGSESSESLFEGFSPELRRSKRTNKGIPAKRFDEEANAAYLTTEEPRNIQEARKSDRAVDWEKAMQEEMSSHDVNGTWELTELPTGRNAIGSKWVYKLKYDASGEVVKHKARLVAQGFAQQYGIDFEEVFAPVTRQSSFRALLAIASRNNIPLVHLDVKTAYLHGELQEELYMRQPPGYVEQGKENLVCRLKRSIYGLKQSARCWNRRLHDILIRMGFRQSSADPCLYLKSFGGKLAYLLVYVDDIVLGCADEAVTKRIFKELKKHLDITNLGELKYFLGMEIQHEEGNYSLSLHGYIEKLAARFGMSNAKCAKTPMDDGFLKQECEEKLQYPSMYRSLVGALLYISVHARPDISVSTSILGRRVSSPTQADWTAAKRVVRYLMGTKFWKLQFTGETGDLVGFTDADWAGDVKSRKSTSGFTFLFGGAAISWISRKQSSVTLSSMEAEYVSLCEACQELVWLRALLKDMGEEQTNATVIHEDNQSCIAFVKSERATRRSKHIETKQQYVKDLCEGGKVELKYCPTDSMTADLLTKPLGVQKIRRFAEMIGMRIPMDWDAAH